MKTYPKIDGKQLDKYSRRKMDKYEEIIKSYLEMEESRGYNFPNYLAYNIAFLLLDEK